jgi:hypothetical protein
MRSADVGSSWAVLPSGRFQMLESANSRVDRPEPGVAGTVGVLGADGRDDGAGAPGAAGGVGTPGAGRCDAGFFGRVVVFRRRCFASCPRA